MAGVAVASGAVRVAAAGVGPRWFRFADTNPLTGKAYWVSRWADLPYAVAAAVERMWGLGERGWDALVRSGEIVDLVGGREYPLPETLDLPLRKPRVGRAPVGTCPDCWGTEVEIDRDGSMTGTVGASFVCICAAGR